MITLICSLAFLGFYMLYSTSKRAELTLTYKLQNWTKENQQIGKYIGISLLLISFILCIVTLGFGVGFFYFLVIIMTIGSLVVLVSPLRFFNLFTLLIVTILSFGVEIYLT